MKSETSAVTGVWVDPFVAAYQMDDTFPCLEIIEQTEFVGTGLWEPSLIFDKVLPEQRDSDQIIFSINPVSPTHEPLLSFAGNCLDHYLASLPQADRFPPFRLAECYNMIRYRPGQAFHGVHSDYFPSSKPWCDRHLSFVLFLNTIEDGGELEFPQQNL